MQRSERRSRVDEIVAIPPYRGGTTVDRPLPPPPRHAVVAPSPIIPIAPITRPMIAVPAAVVPAPPPPPPPQERECTACCLEQQELIRPCSCSADYCHDCLEDRFLLALQDKTMFPARCCALIQLHTVLPNLSSEHASEYRSRFEEWISRNKTYCPKPSCSAFIPDRIVENAKPLVPTTIRGFLNNILSKMSASPSSRFVREELDITYMPGDTSVIASPIYLADMQAKLEEYESLEGLTQDVQLLVSNAHLHGSDHPIAQAADELFNLCLHEISKSFDQQSCEIGALSSFACPACNIAICAQCKKSEHRGQACDDSEHEQEMAMLEKFGYKQCPHCRTGVRKMFGCSFIVCRCGAGWCWGCTRSIDICDGQCGMDLEDDEEEEQSEHVIIDLDTGAVIELTYDQRLGQGQNDDAHNLDAGGAGRWAHGDLDFGDEPEEDLDHQVWSCRHSWRKYRDPKDGFFHGNQRYIECNKCFKACPYGKGAFMCGACRLLVCAGCKET